MDLKIRTALPDEYAALGDLTAAAYVDGAGLAPDDSYLPHLRDVASRAGSGAEVLAAVADSGEVLGGVTYVPAGTPHAEISRPGEAEVRTLAVSAAARGRGVGEALMQACVDRARTAGLDRLVLCVIAANEGPQRLYRRIGFRRLPSRDWEPFPGALLAAYELPL